MCGSCIKRLYFWKEKRAPESETARSALNEEVDLMLKCLKTIYHKLWHLPPSLYPYRAPSTMRQRFLATLPLVDTHCSSIAIVPLRYVKLSRHAI